MLNENQQKLIKLNNGIEMPQIGFGVWKIPFNQTAKVVTDAIKNHYRLIDTAKQYGNEEQVGQGIKDSGIEQKQLFLTTKIFNGDQGDFDKLRNAFNEQLKKLGTDHVDLLLLHWPVFNRLPRKLKS